MKEINQFDPTQGKRCKRKIKYPENAGGWCRLCLSIVNRIRKYNIDLDGLDALISHQNGECAICRSAINRSSHVDHDKEIEQKEQRIVIRGILCGHCNIGLGHFFFHTAVNLVRAAEYLVKSDQKNEKEISAGIGHSIHSLSEASKEEQKEIKVKTKKK